MNNKFLDTTTPIIQMMGDPYVYIATCALLCAFGNEKMFETGKLSSAAFIESGFIAYAIKKIVGRPRPLNNSLCQTKDKTVLLLSEKRKGNNYLQMQK